MFVIPLLERVLLHLLAEFGRPRRIFEGVVFELHHRWSNLCPVCQVAHRRLSQRTGVTRLVGQYNARWDRAGIIGKHQRIAPVAAFKKVEDTFFCGQALQECKVTFLILHTKFPFRVGMAQAEDHIADTVLFQNIGDNGFNVQLLENTRILTQGGAPQVRANKLYWSTHALLLWSLEYEQSNLES
ncbi:hypothetical protein Xekk_03868 [Xenorhabdus sp. KK7.4]|nr:hypothetical protein Xekk_03868 [Xenorhabdus sp. KK7.4]